MYHKNKSLLDNLFPGLTEYLESVPTIEENEDTSIEWLDKIPSEGWKVAVVFGFDDRLIEGLLNKYPDRIFMVVELFPGRLKKYLQTRDLTSIFGNENFYMVCKEDYHEAAVDVVMIMRKNNWQDDLVLIGCDRKEEIWSDLEREINDVACMFGVNDATINKSTVKWISNFFKNIKRGVLDTNIEVLFDKFKGMPAVIVGSGPSLDDSISSLKRNREKVIVVAAGSAVNPLVKNGIYPDLLVSIDGNEANYLHFKNLDTVNIPMAYCASIYPKCLSNYKGDRFSFSLDVFPWMTDFYKRLQVEKGVLVSGPSVANVAVDLADKMGCSPIIFVGLDFAFTDKTHSKDAEHTSNSNAMGNLFKVEANRGGLVNTSMGFYVMKLWIEQRIKADNTYINATEGGAKIAGVNVMSLDEALKMHGKRPRYDFKYLCRSSDLSGHNKRIMLGRIKKEVKNERKRLNYIEKYLWLERRDGVNVLDVISEVAQKDLFFRAMISKEVKGVKDGKGYDVGFWVIDELRKVIK